MSAFHDSPIAALNSSLKETPRATQPVVVCLLGSSGCGKTFLCRALAEQLDSERAAVIHFDSIGVPSTHDMIERFGSCENWQKETTYEWARRISRMHDKTLVVFEGQYHPQFALDAFHAAGLRNVKLGVVTCNESVWADRLRGPREQPDLVTEEMRNWARVLRAKTLELGGALIDTSASNLARNIGEVCRLAVQLLKAREAG